MLLLRRRERDGAVESGNTDNWTVQIVKCFFVDDGRDLARNSARFRVLVQDDHLISLSDGLQNGISIERCQRAQVNHFEFNFLFRQKLGGFQSCMHHGSVSNHAEVTARAHHTGLPERNNIVVFRDFSFDAAIEIFVLEEDNGIVVADGGFNQPLSVVRRRGANDFQSGIVHKPHFRILRMKWAAVHAASAWATHHQRRGRTPQIMRLRHHVADLVHGAGDKIHELEFCDWAHSGQRRSECRAHNGGFRNGRVDYTLGAEPIYKAVRNFECAAVDADVLAQAEHCRVPLHLLPDSLANGFQISELRHI